MKSRSDGADGQWAYLGRSQYRLDRDSEGFVNVSPVDATSIQADENRKIDEPKTPYVRYDAENDLVLGGELNIASHVLRSSWQMYLDST